MNEAGPTWFPFQPDVLWHIKLIYQSGVLIDHGNAQVMGMPWRFKSDRFSTDLNPAAVRAMDAGQNAHQGRFPGTILAYQPMYLASPAIKRDLHQGANTRERFVHLCDC